MVSRPRIAALGLTLASVGCGPLDPPGTTGGVSVEAGAYGRGHALVMSDYQSTNVALLDCDGRTLSGSFVSSGAATPGLAAPLSGDVVLPSDVQSGSELALIDRYPAAIVTLVDIATGTVTGQIDVGTGFRSNPQDLFRSDERLWISRYETNPKAGTVPFDAGGDVVIVDRNTRAIVERIDLAAAMADAPGFLPRPGRMVAFDGRLYVLLAAYDASFSDAAPSRIVTLDIATHAILGVHRLDSLAGCSALALQPPFDRSGVPRALRRLVVGCSGRFQGSSSPDRSDSGLVALEPHGDELVEWRRWGSTELADRPVGFDLAIDESGRVLVTTMGRLGDGSGADVTDALIEVGLDDGATRVVWETTARPFELGGVRCTTRTAAPTDGDTAASMCGSDCFLADGEGGLLRRLVLGPTGYEASEALQVEPAIGLPPRWLGRF